MRLICPNCDAQYEVDDALVPAEGRDVQCSNCNTTWFQAGPGAEEGPTPPPLGMAPKRPELSDEARNILSEEVARETAARQAETGGLETQPDLGLDDGVPEERANAARDRMDRRRGFEPEAQEISDLGAEVEPAEDPEADVSGSAKSDLLPDIEEINSTLDEAPVVDDDPDTAEAAAKAARANKSGFRIGFGLALIIFAALIIAYVMGPRLSEQMPALAETLAQYRVTVDGLRVWLDGAAQAMVDQINSMIGQVSGQSDS